MTKGAILDRRQAGERRVLVTSDAAHAVTSRDGSGRHPTTCPVLIGRDEAVAELRGLVEAAGPETRQLALIAGEAGLGKSRLVAETTAFARERGFRVLTGASFPRDQACPFGPILDMLRASLERLPAECAEPLVQPFARELAPLLPGLVRPPATTDATLLPAPDIERERRQLFAALAQCLLGPATRTAPAQPTCLVVEDIHWCDDVSLDFLDALARGLGPGTGQTPLVILATYRSDDAEPGLRRWLAGLDRARLAREIHLRPLTRDETVQLLTATFSGATLPLGMADAIHELAEGNPFQVEELLGALVAAGEIVHTDGAWRWSGRPVQSWKLPRSLYEAVQERTARIGHAARELLTLAAVVGRRFDFELLQRLAEVDERTLLALVKELIAAGLVVEEDDGRFAFRHALTRQSVYGELLARERVALHRTVGEMTEQLFADTLDQYVGDLAYHFAEAASWEKALRYACRAAERARRLAAPRAVVDQLTRAIEACGKLSGDRRTALAGLYLERARASDTVGDLSAAVADAEQALTLAEQAGDQRAAWQAQVDLGLYWAGRDYAQARPFLEGALTLARTHGDPAMLAHSLNRLGNWLANTEQPRDAMPLHREALAIFEGLEDRAGVAATLDLLGMAAILRADLDTGIAYYDRAAALMETLDDHPGLATCLAVLSARGGSYELGSVTTTARDFEQGLRDGERAMILARELGWPAGEAFACSQVTHTYGMLGQYARGLEIGRRALNLAQQIGHLQWAVAARTGLGALQLDMLAFEEARAEFEQAQALAREIRSTFWTQLATGQLAWTHIQAAQTAPAPARAEHLAAAATLLGERPTATGPVESLGESWIVFGHAQLALAQGKPSHALGLFGRLSITGDAVDLADGQHNWAGLTPRPALGVAMALAALGRHTEAETLLRDTLEIVERQGCRPLAWRCLLALADLYAASGRTNEAQAAYQRVRGTVETLAAELTSADLRDGLVQQVAARLPRAHRPGTRQSQTLDRRGGLTAREHEVAGLVAAGHTNREIAEMLVLGERTIETHVSNVLAKLSLASRREIARWYANNTPA